VPEPGFRLETQRTILGRARSLFGERAKIELSLVEHIDPLPSGKRSYILSTIAQGEGDVPPSFAADAHRVNPESPEVHS